MSDVTILDENWTATIVDEDVFVATASFSGVSSVSVVTANGVSGTVATATTTPAITLTINTINGGTP